MQQEIIQRRLASLSLFYFSVDLDFAVEKV
jgi:hypothetical protein